MSKKILLVIFLLIIINLLTAEQEVGLVLSGGGARGLSHIGVLQVIDSLNIKIDSISGTSIGALIGALYSIGYSPDEIEEIIINENWYNIINDNIQRNKKSMYQKRWGKLSNIKFPIKKSKIRLPQGFINGQYLLNFILKYTYPALFRKDFEKYPISFNCTATNLINGRQKVFRKDNIIEALRTSMSVPSIFKPFSYNDSLYIDGGITSNLPIESTNNNEVKYIIAAQANTKMKPKNEIVDIFDVLNQTINIGITEKTKNSLKKANLLIQPDLKYISNTDFNQKKKIISLGKKAAYKSLSELKKLPKRRKKTKKLSAPDSIYISKIDINNNKNVSSTKIKEFAKANPDQHYNLEKILRKINNLYSSELFDYIYPDLKKLKRGYKLTFTVEEKNPVWVGTDFEYDLDNNLSAGGSIDLINKLQNNSRLILDFRLGGKNELNIDYVKNFGKHWGIYYRLFPSLSIKRTFFYNDEHEKERSIKTLRIGSTIGLGVFASNYLVLETYDFMYKNELYKDISESEFIPQKSFIHGIGFKMYHESLDNLVFPMRGGSFFLNFKYSSKNLKSDLDYKRLKAETSFHFEPIDDLSLYYKFEYGSYFEKDSNPLEPFYIGGLDSAFGYHYNEHSAPFYKFHQIGTRVNIKRRYFLDFKYNFFSLGNSDTWKFSDIYWGLGTQLGIKTILGPIRYGLAFNRDLKLLHYLSIGYQFDAFKFSR